MIPEVEKQMCVTVENMIILLTNYTDKACWKRAVFFAEVCLNWIEELDPGNEYVKETRKGIDEFYNDSENAKWKEVNENLTERNDVEDRQGVQRIHIGFDTPGQDPGTWFTGIDKALFEIVKEKKDKERFFSFGCRGSEADYVARSSFYPN